MRKLLLLLMISAPLVMCAQNEWQLPKQRQQQEEKAKSKTKNKAKSESADAKKQSDKNTTDAKSTKAKQKAVKIDSKYAAGTVPLVDGKVEWDVTVNCPGQSADQLYNRVEQFMENKTHEKNQINSQISAVNPKEHVVAGVYVEEMVFSSNFVSKDFTDFRYTLIATCHDGSVNLRLCRISYKYNVGRPEEATYMAEDWITDKEAINKAGTKLYRGNGKFRRKTIDRKDVIFSELEKMLKN